MIPKYITAYMQYRDAANWKNGATYGWTNQKGYTEEFLEETLSPLFNGEPVIAYYWGLPNMAPMDNEFLPSYGDDHSFVEADDLEFHPEKAPQYDLREIYGDIDEVVQLVLHPEEREKRKQEKLREAREFLSSHLNDL